MPDFQTLQVILDYVKSIDSKVDALQKKVDNNTERLDKIGLQVAQLSDDSPTIKEFDSLEKRVTKLEDQFSKN